MIQVGTARRAVRGRPGGASLPFLPFNLQPSTLDHARRPPRHRLFDDVRNLRDLVNTHERIHFGQEFGQFVAETLRQAARNNQALAVIGHFPDLGRFENRVHAFFLCGVNERAGVDDDRVGLRGVIGDFHAAFQERTEHDFGVHKILGAAERNQPDAQWAFALWLSPRRSLRRSLGRPHQRVFTGMFFRHRRIKLREAAVGVENYLATELELFVPTASVALVETVAGSTLGEAVSGGN